jgi:hypothetical protein
VNVSYGAHLLVKNNNSDPNAPGVEVGYSGTLGGDGSLTLTGSTSSTNNITAHVFGTLTPGTANGRTLTIEGNLALDGNANTVFNVFSLPFGQGHDEVHVLQTTGGGQARLGGRISVTMDGTFTPGGTPFLLLHADAGLNQTRFDSQSINQKQTTGPCFTPVIQYDANNVYLYLKDTPCL